MKLGIRILKASKLLRFFLFRILVPVWNWLVSGLEAIYWTLRTSKRDRTKYQFIVAGLRGGTVESLSYWYSTARFKYKSDPVRGVIDYSSRPWVTVLKMSGDCDDMARLAYEVLGLGDCYPTGYESIEWIFLYGRRGGHAVTIAKQKDVGYWVMNNQRIEGPFAHKWDALESANFGEMPDLWARYKIRKGTLSTWARNASAAGLTWETAPGANPIADIKAAKKLIREDEGEEPTEASEATT